MRSRGTRGRTVPVVVSVIRSRIWGAVAIERSSVVDGREDLPLRSGCEGLAATPLREHRLDRFEQGTAPQIRDTGRLIRLVRRRRFGKAITSAQLAL